jgi:hypothetical protein
MMMMLHPVLQQQTTSPFKIYLMIIKDTLPVLLGVSPGDIGMERAILTVSTMAVILPISMQRVSVQDVLMR